MLMFASAVRAARGCRRGYLRLRVTVAAMLALRGAFWLRMKIEQSAYRTPVEDCLGWAMAASI